MNIRHLGLLLTASVTFLAIVSAGFLATAPSSVVLASAAAFDPARSAGPAERPAWVVAAAADLPAQPLRHPTAAR